MKAFNLLLSFFILITSLHADPGWFKQDYKAKKEWGFYCQGEGKDENEALGAARSQCAGKVCMLFGVEVDHQVVLKEGLKDVSVESQTIERCPKVRVVGRVEKKKNLDCDSNKCFAYIWQLYPLKEYKKEYERLNRPQISKTIEKTIVIREGNETFNDPKKCLEELGKYSKIRGEQKNILKQRVESLTIALKECKKLDYRDTRLQGQVSNLIQKSLYSRDVVTTVNLNQKLLNSSEIIGKIEILKSHEEDLLKSYNRVPKLKKFLEKKYDALFGNRGPYLEYLAELKSCQVHADMLLLWPKNFTNTLKICREKENSKEKACFDINMTIARSKYLTCICQRASSESSNQCFNQLFTYLNETCPYETSKECMKSFSNYAAEKMKISTSH